MLDRAPFGRTGHQSSRVVFGAAALGRMRQERADELLPVLLEHGVNHLDVAASYGDAELRLAPWLAGNRDRFFLATKTGERSADGARAELERSLQRLGVDAVDLIQLHNLVEPDEWEVAHGRGGALEGLLRARDEGLTRFVGITGHGLRIAAMHRRSLERFDYDSVLLPYSHALLADDHYRSEVEVLLATCTERQVAVQTIKAVARRRWPDAHQGPRFSWYEPLTDADALARAVRYVVARPGLFLNTSSDARLLRPILEAAEGGRAGADRRGAGRRPPRPGRAPPIRRRRARAHLTRRAARFRRRRAPGRPPPRRPGRAPRRPCGPAGTAPPATAGGCW